MSPKNQRFPKQTPVMQADAKQMSAGPASAKRAAGPKLSPPLGYVSVLEHAREFRLVHPHTILDLYAEEGWRQGRVPNPLIEVLTPKPRSFMARVPLYFFESCKFEVEQFIRCYRADAGGQAVFEDGEGWFSCATVTKKVPETSARFIGISDESSGKCVFLGNIVFLAGNMPVIVNIHARPCRGINFEWLRAFLEEYRRDLLRLNEANNSV